MKLQYELALDFLVCRSLCEDRPAPKKMPRNAKEEPPEASIFDVKSESGDSNISEMLEHENGSGLVAVMTVALKTVLGIGRNQLKQSEFC